jgi:hypothetical protein
MNQTEDQIDPASPAWWSPASLSPKGSAIAGFSLATVSLLGQSAWTNAAQGLFFGTSWPQSEVHWYLLAVVLAPIASAVVGLLLVRRVLTGPTGDDWEVHLARAAVVIAEIAIVLGVIAAVGNLLLQRD